MVTLELAAGAGITPAAIAISQPSPSVMIALRALSCGLTAVVKGIVYPVRERMLCASAVSPPPHPDIEAGENGDANGAGKDDQPTDDKVLHFQLCSLNKSVPGSGECDGTLY